MKYLSPFCESIRIETEPCFAASTQEITDMKGMTEDNPAHLHRILPFYAYYFELEPDIKEKLKEDGENAVNFRTANIGGLDYKFVVITYKVQEDLYLCYYCQVLAHVSEVKRIYVHFNLYNMLELFLCQIRYKVADFYYEYDLSAEVRQKMPTFCKLLSNAEKNNKNPQYGLPMITFLDPEQHDPLLSVCLECNGAITYELIDSVHEPFYKIIMQMEKETEDAGFLDQSRKQLFKNILRVAFMARHFV